MTDQRRHIYLLVENPSKSNNLGPILRCATAFGLDRVVAVGYEQCNVEGSHGASKHVEIVAWPTAKQAADYLRNDLKCTVVVGLLSSLPGGYEASGYPVATDGDGWTKAKHRVATADPEAAESATPALKDAQKTTYPVYNMPLPDEGNICLALGKQHEGLSTALAEHCDHFCHIPHCGDAALVDAPAALSIALYHFVAYRLGYTESSFEGHKFDVTQFEVGKPDPMKKRKRELEQEERQKESEEMPTDFGGIFGKADDGDY